MRRKKFAEDLAGELFVVNNDGADFLCGDCSVGTHVVMATLSAGSDMATR